ncbi:MAG: 1-acyl-sn-glycerol-3-phosphate acyltransferase [Bacteroidales bacterium]|nr:1-acyl-sn-glycerol-3-phosphate acyltransferase [Bacteroidales bacterium]
MTEKSLLIDVEKAIEDKNPRLLKVLPGFVLRYLKKIIHQDDLNEIIQRFHEQEGLDFVEKTLDYMGISYSAEDLENIPEQGRFIFVSNHPLGGLDGLVFIHVIGRIFPDLKFPVNDFLLNIKNLDPVFLPINKHGSQSRDAVRAIEEAYASDSQILYFPAGLCSRKIRGKIVDLEWKKHFITKAIEYKRDIIPVYFSGRNSNFFYNLANLRVLLGIKSNIEMIYLPNEMFKQRGKKLILKVGRPIPYTFFDRTRTAKEWADYVKDIVYSIGSTMNKTND